ncbi:MAG: tetratricopeptide repeat protein, partial [Acidobacteriota bacterium]
MNIILLLFFALCSPIAAVQSPGPQAAAAQRLLDQGHAEKACRAFLSQIESGSRDPWSFRGAALCSLRSENWKRRVTDALEQQSPDSALALYARGYRHMLLVHDGKDIGLHLESAIEALRRSVELAPGFPLAWLDLGQATLLRDSAQEALPHIEKALSLDPEMSLALERYEEYRFQAGSLTRLIELLEEIPLHWDEIPRPAVPISGKPLDEVLSDSADVGGALSRVREISELPPKQRLGRLHPLSLSVATEAELWAPSLLLQGPQRAQSRLSVELGSRLFDAWLQIAKGAGRRDILLQAAPLVFDFVLAQRGFEAISAAVLAWANIPDQGTDSINLVRLKLRCARILFKNNQAEDSLSLLNDAEQLLQATGETALLAEIAYLTGDAYFQLGRNRQALERFRQARDRAVAVSDPLWQSNAWNGEGAVLFRLGDNQAALQAFRRAYDVAHDESQVEARAHSLAKQGEVLFRLGQNDEALEAYRKARGLFEKKDHLPGQALTWGGEGDVHYRRHEIQKALSAYREARRLSEVAGDRRGIANAFNGESKVLAVLGEWQGAIEVLKKAERIFQQIGEPSGQGFSWNGIGQILWAHERPKESLRAFQRALECFRLAGNQAAQALSLVGLSNALLSLKEPDAALKASQEARRLAEAAGSGSALASSWLSEVRVHFELKNWPIAISAAESALKYYASFGEDNLTIGTLLFQMIALLRDGRTEQASIAAQRAIDMHEQVRRSYVTDPQRTRKDVSIASAYELLVVHQVLQTQEFQQALILSEAARSRVFLNLLHKAIPEGEEGIGRSQL